MKVVVTGGSGKGGTWVVRDLRDHGHDVLNVDARHDGSTSGPSLVADLTDLGQTHDALAGADAVVHFAAIPAPGLRPEGETFRINALSTYNVFAAAVAHGVRRVVWASSETVLGLPFDIPPAFAPIDETIDRCERRRDVEWQSEDGLRRRPDDAPDAVRDRRREDVVGRQGVDPERLALGPEPWRGDRREVDDGVGARERIMGLPQVGQVGD